jgi:hypothetical protein
MMGCWGLEAFENDKADSWFEDLWQLFPIPAEIEKTLRLTVEDNHEEIRAAAYVLLQLGDIWPVDLIDQHCDLAARRLEDIKGMEIYAHDVFQVQLQKEIDILRSRISKHFDTNTDKDAD